jgi:hypothetical protein
LGFSKKHPYTHSLYISKNGKKVGKSYNKEKYKYYKNIRYIDEKWLKRL